jgi:hypothetical protein
LSDLSKGYEKILSSTIKSDIVGKKAFIQFDTAEVAEKFVADKNGSKIGEKAIDVQIVNKHGKTAVIKGDYPEQNPNFQQTLEAKVRTFGNVTSFKLQKNDNGKFIVFVDFASKDSVNQVINSMNGQPLEQGGSELYVQMYVSNKSNRFQKPRTQYSNQSNEFKITIRPIKKDADELSIHEIITQKYGNIVSLSVSNYTLIILTC